ncbi:putative two-component sensor kinase [Streptomyces formicae]|uniref:histidine kinase n=2 Tax=Streptomyces formicae TaxID=1616117 RepID=A0A291Q7Y7_9ACTN|nr:histidine kinase [Streptomyces formicae]ATL27658.1 putative two-component sensor kinase [Streptomyces formicae]
MPEDEAVDARTLSDAVRPRLVERVAGMPGPAGRLRTDVLFALVMFASSGAVVGVVRDNGEPPGVAGWSLLVAAHVVIVWRRRAPLGVMLALIAILMSYHLLDVNHTAPMAVSMCALYTVASRRRPLYAVLVGASVLTVMLSLKFSEGMAEGAESLRISGWIVAFLLLGVYVRMHRQYVASVLERAVRAERTREEEARRRVAEERLRVARDLHDLLAHSITLVGVQTSVAAHVLTADPDRLDRAAVAKALDDVAETCRSARGELRATLEVLRSGAEGADDEARGPLPGLDGLPDLAEAARTAGAEVDLSVTACDAPPVVGAAAYRIVQEALTNAVRHAGPDLTVRVAVRVADAALNVTVTDDGVGARAPSHAPGFGLVGMRERARTVGGTLEAGPRPDGGFMVSAVLPLAPVSLGGLT